MEKPKFIRIISMGRGEPGYDCDQVDAYLDKLFKDAVDVLGYSADPTTGCWLWSRDKSLPNTHQALLINIEEIKPEVCEHEPRDTTEHLSWCKHCKVKLKSHWVVVD